MPDETAPELGVYLVFSQRPDARVDIESWSAHAERFFATRLGLAEDKRYPAGAPAPRTDRVRIVVAPLATPRAGDAPGIVVASARPRDDNDLALAERADGAGTGLALLARRCPTVWLVTRTDEDDRLALRLATIFASVLLGPILDPRRLELFGAKTARGKLDEGSR